MASTKISGLSSGNPAQSGDLIPIDRSGSNFSITAASIAALVTGSGTVTSVSGTINQIDVATGTTTPVISLDPVLVAPGSIAATSTVTGPTGVIAGVANTTAGVITLEGGTSGAATLTAPAIAGTVANPLVSSNNISAPALVSTVATGTAPLTVTSTTVVANLNASSLNGATFAAPGTIGGGTASPATFSTLTDTGFFTQGSTGQFRLASTGLCSTYFGAATAERGLAAVLSSLKMAGKSAAIAPTTLITPGQTGFYRVSVYAKVEVAAATPATSVLGGSTGAVLTYTDGVDSVAQSITIILNNQSGAVLVPATGNTGNSTTTVSYGDVIVYMKTGVAATIAFGYTNGGSVAMQYLFYCTAEAL